MLNQIDVHVHTYVS